MSKRREHQQWGNLSRNGCCISFSCPLDSAAAYGWTPPWFVTEGLLSSSVQKAFLKTLVMRIEGLPRGSAQNASSLARHREPPFKLSTEGLLSGSAIEDIISGSSRECPIWLDLLHRIGGSPWVFHYLVWVYDSHMSTPAVSYNSPPMMADTYLCQSISREWEIEKSRSERRKLSTIGCHFPQKSTSS